MESSIRRKVEGARHGLPETVVSVRVIQREQRQRLILQQINRGHVLRKLQLKLQHLHALGQRRVRQLTGVEFVLHRRRLRRQFQQRVAADVQPRRIHQTLEIPLRLQQRVLRLNDRFESLGDARLRPRHFDARGLLQSESTLRAIQLLTRQVVLLKPDVQRLPDGVQRPVRAIRVGELTDDLEFCRRFGDFHVQRGDADGVRVGPTPAAAKQRLTDRKLQIRHVRGIQRREDVVRFRARSGNLERNRPARAQRNANARRDARTAELIAAQLRVRRLVHLAVTRIDEQQRLESRLLLRKRLVGDRRIDERDLQIKVVLQRPCAALLQRQGHPIAIRQRRRRLAIRVNLLVKRRLRIRLLDALVALHVHRAHHAQPLPRRRLRVIRARREERVRTPRKNAERRRSGQKQRGAYENRTYAGWDRFTHVEGPRWGPDSRP
ncbi:MAG: hypothetical protein RIB87_03470 [Pyruvatibacter sp.]